MTCQKDNTEHLFLESGGIRIHVARGGAGAPLVLIHGLGGPLMWDRIAGILRRHYGVLVVDLPGFGESDPPPTGWTTAEYAGMLTHILNALGVRKAALAGVSYGGEIAVHVAHGSPERLSGLILISSTGLLRPLPLLGSDFFWRVISIAAPLTLLRSRWLMCWLGRLSFFDAADRPTDLCRRFFDQLSRKGGREAWLNALRNVYVRNENFLGMLSRISTPTLIVWGEKDRTVPVRFSGEFHSRIAGSFVRTFPRCAHSVPLERPQELYETIREFLVQQEERT